MPRLNQWLTFYRRIAKRSVMRNVSAGWHAHLDLLAAQVEERAPKGFWRSFAVLEPLYAQRLPGA
jgi:hypothetical protein